MGWTKTTSGSWVLSGGETLYLAPNAAPGTAYAVVLRILKASDNVAAAVLASPDGRTRLRVRVDSTNVQIETYTFGTGGGIVDTGDQDVPAFSACQEAHGIAANTPFELQARVFDGVVEAWINGQRKLRYTVPDDLFFVDANPFGRLTHYGFESSVVGAIVQSAVLGSLTLSNPTPQTEALVVVCDGNVFLSLDGTSRTLVGPKAFIQNGAVDLESYAQRVYGVDGVYARVIDPKVPSVDPWGGTTATTALPGATASGDSFIAGTSRMTMVSGFLDRLTLAGDANDPQNVWYSATGSPNDWDTSALESPGRAFALSAAFPGRIGEPVTCVQQSAKGVLIIGTVNQVWRHVGDPALSIPDVSPLDLKSGISGKDAAVLASDGVLLAHGPNGFMLIGAGGVPSDLSGATLTNSITFPPSDRGKYTVLVQRDAPRSVTNIFITPTETTQSGLHFAYDERIGGFRAGRGGFFVDEFAPALNPTASCVFRGKLLVGTRNGLVLNFDDSIATDDGTAFSVVAPLKTLNLGTSADDTILHRLSCVVDQASSPFSISVYGGVTPQDATVGTGRALLASNTVSPYATELIQSCRSGALSVELRSMSGTRWACESVTAWASFGKTRPRAAHTASVSHSYCTLPASSTSGNTGGPGNDPDPAPDTFVWVPIGDDLPGGSPNDLIFSSIDDPAITHNEHDIPNTTGGGSVVPD